MTAERIKATGTSETWKLTDSLRVSYIRFTFDEDEDCVLGFIADHKSPWISGERYESFSAARLANGLPDIEPTFQEPA